MEAMEMTRRGRAVLRVLGSTPARIAGTAVGVLLLLRGVDVGGAMRSLAGVDPDWLLASILLTAVTYALSVGSEGALEDPASPSDDAACDCASGHQDDQDSCDAE
jgi:uncharacterized membrane protein YbhN (UPF0104 family)